MSVLVRQRSRYWFVRYGEGTSPIRQTTTVAPQRIGYWAFFDNFATFDIVPEHVARRPIRFYLSNDAFIWTGWTKQGEITRYAYFNVGDWQLLSVEDAVVGFRRIVAKSRGRVAYRRGNWPVTWRQAMRVEDFQVFIPGRFRIH